MGKEQNLKRPIVSFIILTNIIFIPLFLLTGVTMMLGLPTIAFDMMLCITAWSSTFVLLILFKRIYPGQSIITYVKNKFNHKINWRIVGLIIIIQTLIFIGVLYIVKSRSTSEEFLFTISSKGTLIYFFFKNLLAGPLGEELGWRGFAGQELQKKYSPLKSAIILGFWWGIWHTPTWFTSGFTGMNLVMYILLFMISIISISIIMTVFYNLNNNLIIPIIIHQLFNFLLGLISGNLLELLGYYTSFYVIVAFILMAINPKGLLYARKYSRSRNVSM